MTSEESLSECSDSVSSDNFSIYKGSSSLDLMQTSCFLVFLFSRFFLFCIQEGGEGLGSSHVIKMAAFSSLVRGSCLRSKFASKIGHLSCLSRLFKTKSESLVYSEHGDPEKVLR